MSANQRTFQEDLELELAEAHNAKAEAVRNAAKSEFDRVVAEKEAQGCRGKEAKMDKELTFLRETLVTRLNEAGKKAAAMIEEVEEAAALRVAEIEVTNETD